VRITSTTGFPCLAADDLRDATPYSLLCSNSDLLQQWYYYPEYNSIQSYGGFCLAVQGDSDGNSILSTPLCNYNDPNQQWQLAIGRPTTIQSSSTVSCIATTGGSPFLEPCGSGGTEEDWIAIRLEGEVAIREGG